MSDQAKPQIVSRRQTIAGMGLAGVALAQTTVSAQAAATPAAGRVLRHLSVPALVADDQLQPGDWVETLGFHAPGDGGAARYALRAPGDDLAANGADVLAVGNGLLAVLHAGDSVNYQMFGAVGDGEADDGVQIKLAHEYAIRHDLPVINLSGEYWIKQTNSIPIQTPVQWGKSVFHIDERFNDLRLAKFYVRNDEPIQNLTENAELKAALLAKLKPGVQIIAELAPYAGCLISVQDNNDRIGIRAGYEGNRGWAREELFYVEEEGRVLGDIAWAFSDFTSILVTPCNRNYLVIEGGGFLFSGDTPENSRPGYHQNGFVINRSRTIIRHQWCGLEPGRRDMSLEPRSGIYSLGRVYDVTLENIRAMPWEKGRRAPETPVAHGTYGIGGARWLNCTFRNLTAEGGWVAWGVFGTNLNKNFRIERCHLNRVDVHFHCWNLYIVDSTIGFKGISVTGGGDLFIDRTTRHGNNFVSFRPDYGATWDGPIRMRGCTLKPSGNGRVSVLSMRPSNFDYQYQTGLGTSVSIEDLRIDYSAAPASADPCILMDVANFSVNQHGQRLFFPQRLVFRDIIVQGRERGVRLLHLPRPQDYDVRREGGVDDARLRPNATLICDSVHLERLTPERPDDAGQVQFLLGGNDDPPYADSLALYLRAVFTDCENVSLFLANCAVSVFFDRCTINTLTARNLRGELNFNNCRFQPELAAEPEAAIYALDSSLGTRFTSCTLHAPTVAGTAIPSLLDRLGIVELNRSVRHAHLNTALGNEVVAWLRELGIALRDEFIAQLRLRHPLED